jgi:hypothetical protein
VIRVILLVGVATALAGAAQPGRVAGRAIDSAGNPLAQVRVISLPWEDTYTDHDGRFVLEKPAQLIRFSKAGYRPITKKARADRLDIVMQPGADSAWTPPACSPKGVRRFGETMMFAAPLGVRLQTTTDVDYRTVRILNRGSTLEFGTGPHWTYGLPVAQVLEAMVLVDERDVRTPWGDPGAEYRGVRADGKHWRAVYLFGQSIGYDGADAIAAKYFDGIIDSLCFKWP